MIHQYPGKKFLERIIKQVRLCKRMVVNAVLRSAKIFAPELLKVVPVLTTYTLTAVRYL